MSRDAIEPIAGPSAERWGVAGGEGGAWAGVSPVARYSLID
ncbi:MAG: hypothetical protein ACFB2W_00930 [Leptolyngbyaceae cyanobacterium]